jgi:hypothetical protein
VSGRQVYTVEIDGQQVDIEGDRPPNESEARAALVAHTSSTQQPGAVSRFMAPIGEAARGVLGLPAAIARGVGQVADATAAASQGNAQPMVDVGQEMYDSFVGPNVEQARQAVDAFKRGHYSEAAGRGVAAALPVVGPAAAHAGETMASGNVAGGLGEATVALAPFARAPKFADRLALLMKNRAAARIFDVMKPTAARAAVTEKIAPEVVAGIASRQTAGGIGVGNRAALAKRALERKAAAGEAVAALQSIDTPVNADVIPAKLRAAAAKRETLPPERVEVQPRNTGLVDQHGQPIVDMEEVTVQPPPVSKNPALVSALRGQAQDLEDLASQYPEGKIPAGELFKQRAVTNERIGDRAYEKMPGQTTAPHPKADKAFAGAISDLAHDPQWGPTGLGGSKLIDHDNHVWSKAATNLENSRLRDLVGRKFDGVKDLLVGRLAGIGMGAATGLYASGGSHLAGVTGAILGGVLGESAYWGSLRAATYSDIAKALAANDIDRAASIIQRTATTYALDKSIRDRERHRRAATALQNQAKGSPTP